MQLDELNIFGGRPILGGPGPQNQSCPEFDPDSKSVYKTLLRAREVGENYEKLKFPNFAKSAKFL